MHQRRAAAARRRRRLCRPWLWSLLVVATTLPLQAASADPAARVIVKYRQDALLLRQQALSQRGAQVTRAQAMGSRLGMPLAAGASVSDRSEVLTATGITSEQLAARLAAQSDVEYAVPDGRVQLLTAPDDEHYESGPPIVNGRGGPVVGQWYLRTPTAEVPSGLGVEAAWDVTFGHPSVVVAVVDTGVRFDHPDLRSVAAGGNLLAGFDMISDVDAAADGNGRDSDASDPGDFVTSQDVINICGGRCRVSNSSWHGTEVSGLIAAQTGNGVGIASVGRTLQVLPVRVLGKGGGFDSDVIAGLRWAGGLGVAGVPTNPTPARVLNVSLGSASTCSAAYQETLNELAAAGVTVIVAAGNSVGHAVGAPGNCNGAITVTALRHAGSKVGFSDIGPQIAISAPGGNCVDIGIGDACRFPIMTTSNAGTSFPIAGVAGAIYTGSFDPTLGTSFSAPLVAGVAGLLLSAQPALTPAQVRQALTTTARPFPTTGADSGDGSVVPQCFVPQPLPAAQVDQLQCYCTTNTCGAGMLDAGAALASVSTLRARIGSSPAVAVRGQALTLDASASQLAGGRVPTAWQWRIIDGGGVVDAVVGSSTQPTATVNPTATGSFLVGLTLTDSGGLRATTEQRIVVRAAVSALLDVDQDGTNQALTDGLLTVRYLFGFAGAALTADAVGADAQRTDPRAIASYLAANSSQFDIDGDGRAEALTDGLLLLRYLFGFSGSSLAADAVGDGAARASPAAIATYLESLAP